MATPTLTLRLPATWRAAIPRITISEQHRRFLIRSTVMALGVRLGLLAAAYLIGYIVLGREGASIQEVIRETWDRWDSDQFENIAEHWYPTEGDMRLQIVFLPGYPVAMIAMRGLIYPIHLLFLDGWLVEGLLVSSIAAVFAGFFIQALVVNDGGDEAEADRAAWYLFLFPTAYFLAMPYSESLFLALVLGSFMAARTGHWGWAGLLGMYACFTRVMALPLIPALAFQAYASYKWEAPRKAYWLALVPLGFLAYLAINWIVWDDILKFQEFQEQHWFHKTIWPWEFLEETYRTVRDSEPGFFRAAIYELRLASVLLIGGLLLIGAPRLPGAYQVYGWVSLLMLMSVTWQISMPRYLLGVFPIFLVLAFLGRVPTIHQLVLTTFPLLMGVLFVVYITSWGF